MKITVMAVWDDEAKVWVATSDDVPGLVVEGPTVELLRQKVLALIPELLELNGMAQPHGADLPLHLHYEEQRTVHIA
ncbi:MAG: DUF1902 domain-containing protein [Gammaproteobacteria bacterium]|nr:DUF1902 domain-containing protein [Gammaproteobacteria bacterium]